MSPAYINQHLFLTAWTRQHSLRFCEEGERLVHLCPKQNNTSVNRLASRNLNSAQQSKCNIRAIFSIQLPQFSFFCGSVPPQVCVDGFELPLTLGRGRPANWCWKNRLLAKLIGAFSPLLPCEILDCVVVAGVILSQATGVGSSSPSCVRHLHAQSILSLPNAELCCRRSNRSLS